MPKSLCQVPYCSATFDTQHHDPDLVKLGSSDLEEPRWFQSRVVLLVRDKGDPLSFKKTVLGPRSKWFQTETLAEMQAAQLMIDFRNLHAIVHLRIPTWHEFASGYHDLQNQPEDCQQGYFAVQELAGTRIVTHDSVQNLPGGWEGNPDGGECTPSPYTKPSTTKIQRLHPSLVQHTRCEGRVAGHSDPTGEHACKCFTCLEIIDEPHGDMVQSLPYLVRYGMLGDKGVNLGASTPGHYGFRIQHPSPVFLHTPAEGPDDNRVRYGHPRDS